MDNPQEHRGIPRPQKLLELYEKAKGKPAETIKELTKWMMSPAGKLATAGDPIHATVGL